LSLLYISRKIHTRSSLPPDHPSLAQGLTMKLSSYSYGKSNGKIGKTREANELGFQEVDAMLSALGLHGGNQKTKLPLLHNTRIHAPDGHFEKSRLALSDGWPVTAPRLASTQALQSRCMTSTSKSPKARIAHQSDQYPPVRLVKCCSASVFSLGFVAKPRNLVVLW
jgi:hypothetical protein